MDEFKQTMDLICKFRRRIKPLITQGKLDEVKQIFVQFVGEISHYYDEKSQEVPQSFYDRTYQSLFAVLEEEMRRPNQVIKQGRFDHICKKENW
jgi:hypothetical protein